MSALVLVIEDEPKIAALLRDYLVAAGYRVGLRDTGAGAIDWVHEQAADALLLDLMLPGTDGLAICRGVRARSDLPILMITARVEEIDRLLGLELGADDYICKPFSPREVVARVRAVLRRASMRADPQPDALELDDERFEARVRGCRLDLTPVELRLLRKLSRQPGRVHSRAQLIDAAYEDHRVVSERTVDSHIKNLRRKLAEVGVDPIASVYGVGYRYEPDLPDDASTRST
ncbi:response regulator [Dokdonella sp.]|uniref:response regulator n=1 Tax=Dokdonella sp. TaxID=2291710 RepID=UPI002F41BE80